MDETRWLDPPRTALLVIDMQRAFLERGAALEVPEGRKIIPNVKALLETCRDVSVPVVFTRFVYSTAVPCLRGNPFGIEHLPARPGQSTGSGFPSGNCLVAPQANQGANAPEIIADLAPRDDELVVSSHLYDKFHDTPLDLALRSRDVRCLIVTGVVTEICVNATLMGAANRDYRVTVATDGVAPVSPELQQACFQIWQRKFARLATTGELIVHLRNGSHTPNV